jgi:hypothetical protein
MLLCLVPSAAWAVDWSLRSTESETVALDSNMFLSPNPIGGTLGSYSTISANAEARTPTSKFDFDSYVNYNKYFGPGASTLPDTENLAYGFKGHYETYGKNNSDRTYLDAGYNSSSAAFALLNQLGVLTNVVGAHSIQSLFPPTRRRRVMTRRAPERPSRTPQRTQSGTTGSVRSPHSTHHPMQIFLNITMASARSSQSSTIKEDSIPT